MGMYDSCFVNCPNCNELVEFQSKAGPCSLYRYRFSAPAQIVADLEGDTEKCPKCGISLQFSSTLPARVQFFATPYQFFDDEGDWD